MPMLVHRGVTIKLSCGVAGDTQSFERLGHLAGHRARADIHCPRNLRVTQVVSKAQREHPAGVRRERGEGAFDGRKSLLAGELLVEAEMIPGDFLHVDINVLLRPMRDSAAVVIPRQIRGRMEEESSGTRFQSQRTSLSQQPKVGLLGQIRGVVAPHSSA